MQANKGFYNVLLVMKCIPQTGADHFSEGESVVAVPGSEAAVEEAATKVDSCPLAHNPPHHTAVAVFPPASQHPHQFPCVLV